MKHSKQASSYSGWWFLLSGLPLIIYPGVFVASIMSIAASPASGGGEFSLLLLVSQVFLYGSLLYPVAFIVALVLFFVLKSPKAKKRCVLFPFLYLLLLLILLTTWWMMDV